MSEFIPSAPIFTDPLLLDSASVDAAAQTISLRGEAQKAALLELDSERLLLSSFLLAAAELRPEELKMDYLMGAASALQLLKGAEVQGTLQLTAEPYAEMPSDERGSAKAFLNHIADVYGRSEIVSEKINKQGTATSQIRDDSLIYELSERNSHIANVGLKMACRTIRQPIAFGEEFLARGGYKYYEEHFNSPVALTNEQYFHMAAEAHLFTFLQGYSECLMALHRAEDTLSFKAQFEA